MITNMANLLQSFHVQNQIKMINHHSYHSDRAQAKLLQSQVTSNNEHSDIETDQQNNIDLHRFSFFMTLNVEYLISHSLNTI